jgi:hypothetical protein
LESKREALPEHELTECARVNKLKKGLLVLKSYEGIYDHGKLRWLGDSPPEGEAHVIVTVLEDDKAANTGKVVHVPSERIAGKGKILGDIISSSSAEEDWNCLK